MKVSLQRPMYKIKKLIRLFITATVVFVIVGVIAFEIRFQSGLNSPILFGEYNQISIRYTSEKLKYEVSDNRHIRLSKAYLITDATNQVRFRFTTDWWFKNHDLFSVVDFSIITSNGQFLTQNAGVNCTSILGRDSINMTILLSQQELLSLRGETLNVCLSLRENRLQSDTEFAGCYIEIQIPD